MAADVTAILRRHDQLKRKRLLIEYNWREAYDYTYPLRGATLALGPSSGNTLVDENAAHSYARSQVAKIFDTTATDSVRTLASSLMAGLTPANSRWPGYGVDGIDDDELPDDARVWLDESAEIVFKNINNSNYAQVKYECEVDMSIAGWFVLFTDEDQDEGGYVFEQWALSGVWAAASKPAGELDIFHRQFQLSAEQAVNEYGPNMVSQGVRDRATRSPDDVVAFIQVVEPRPGPHGYLSQNLPISSCTIERDTKKIVRERGYHEHPISAPRWLLIPNSVYPVGPVFDALPDIKSLNKAVEMSFANMDLALAGMWIGEDDGVMNPRTLRVGPRKIVVANSVDSLKPLEPPGDFQLGALEITRLQRQIRKVLMSDQLEPQPQPGPGGRPGAPITATQAQINVELIRQLLGPVYGRMQSEDLKRTLMRCFGLAYRAGALGRAPQSLEGRKLHVKYQTPIGRSQKLVDVAAMDRNETTLAQEMAAGRPEVADNYDWDAAARKRAQLLGVPADLTVDEDVRDERRRRRTEAQAAQRKAELAAPIIAQAMKGAPA